MAILSLRPLGFKTRNPARDQQTDAERLGSVRAALVEAIDSARREGVGLQKRIDLHHAQAVSVMDSSGEYGERDSEDEAAVVNAEANAARAQARVVEVDQQIARLTALLDQFDAGTELPERLDIA